MSEHNLFSHNKKYQFKNKFYYQKYLLFPNDSFIQFLDTLNESRFNYIYIHIPKNAGTTIRYKLKKLYDCLITSNPNNDSCIQGTRQVININHTPFRNYQHPQKLICFVRNPLSRCFSMFYYHKLHKRFWILMFLLIIFGKVKKLSRIFKIVHIRMSILTFLY